MGELVEETVPESLTVPCRINVSHVGFPIAQLTRMLLATCGSASKPSQPLAQNPSHYQHHVGSGHQPHSGRKRPFCSIASAAMPLTTSTPWHRSSALTARLNSDRQSLGQILECSTTEQLGPGSSRHQPSLTR